MRCIYYDTNKKCRAKAPAMGERLDYKPEDDVVKAYCTTSNFLKCPRMIAYHARLQVLSKK